MSARRLCVLVKQLPHTSALVRAMTDGKPPFDRTEHLIADLWALWAKQDHPVRAEVQAKAHNEAKRARVIALKAKHDQRKRKYGLAVT